ncbi:type VI secretion system baseplate subunit TssG [Azotobacter chroococcum]|uniref:type VI secretion system baseplate subunit TssG n=1 Tax=Azotobacter chroococcum TaxID=353 RepID=UPI001469D7D2|nr:type VI secretion system baseplate subunit TssG [Azotobacter chroococcum]
MKPMVPPLRAPLQRLREEPWRFTFFQAVRLLRRQSEGAELRFGANLGLGFPATELSTLESRDDGRQLRLLVNFLGLTGPSGVLAQHYSETLTSLERQGDTATRDFLDLFNHRLLELFWRAWSHYRPEIATEQGRIDSALQHVYDLIGLGTPGLRPHERPLRGLPASALGFYSGLIAQRPHGPGSLEQIMSHWLGAPVMVESCVGTWQRIPAAQCSRLGQAAMRLADDCQLGSHYWDRQNTLRLRIGPLSQAAFERLLPCAEDGGARLAGAVELASLMTGLALDLRIRLIIAAEAVPMLRLGTAFRLGWNTWLAGQRRGLPRQEPAEDCEFRFNATGDQSWR